MHSHSILLLTKSFGQWSAGTCFHPATGDIVDEEIDCTSVYPLQGKYVRVWIPVRFLVEKRHRAPTTKRHDDVIKKGGSEDV